MGAHLRSCTKGLRRRDEEKNQTGASEKPLGDMGKTGTGGNHPCLARARAGELGEPAGKVGGDRVKLEGNTHHPCHVGGLR